MRKLKRDISPSDKDNPSRQLGQVQELVACRQVLRAGNLQIGWRLPGRNNDPPSFQFLFPYFDSRWTSEARPAMEPSDTGVCELVFASLWNGLSERPLKPHQLSPIHLKLCGLNSLPLHSPAPVEDFCGPNEHFLWVASPQGACTSERS